MYFKSWSLEGCWCFWPKLKIGRISMPPAFVHLIPMFMHEPAWRCASTGCPRSRRIRSRLNGQYSLGVPNPCLPLDLQPENGTVFNCAYAKVLLNAQIGKRRLAPHAQRPHLAATLAASGICTPLPWRTTRLSSVNSSLTSQPRPPS